MRARFVCGGVAGLVAAGVALASPPAFATYPGQNGKFVSGGSWIATRNPDGSDAFQVTTPPPGSSDSAPAWSPNGQRIAFKRFLTNPNQDDIYVVNADGTAPTPVTQTANQDEEHPSFSPDGTKLVFGNCCFELDVINVNGTGRTVLATAPPNTFFTSPKWSPDGTRIAFLGGPSGSQAEDIYTVNANGSGVTNLTNSPTDELTFDWSPDGSRIVFSGRAPNDPSNDVDVYVMNRDGTGKVDLTPNPSQFDAALLWSPDGSQILFGSSRSPSGLYLMNPDGSSPSWFEESLSLDDWQPAAVAAPAGPVRPKGATPVRVPLVPAFRKCNAPDLTHGGSLAFGSCSRPIQLSQYLTVGTPDSNGRGANAVDAITFAAVPGDPSTPANEADVALRTDITDVRDSIRYSDYLAELRVIVNVRLTQRTQPQTTVDFPFGWSLPCVATPDPSVGATCHLNTTANALLPGAVPEGYKSIWQLGQVQVQDGGEDGVGSTEVDNTLYLKEGVFVP